MKKFFYLLFLISVLCIQVNATGLADVKSSGRALISNWYNYTDGHTIFQFSNISTDTITVYVSLIAQDGTFFAGIQNWASSALTSFATSGTNYSCCGVLAPNATAYIYTTQASPAKIGYGEIKWESSNSKIGTALIGQAIGLWSGGYTYYIPMNNGNPF